MGMTTTINTHGTSATGYATTDSATAAAVTINLPFTPRYVRFVKLHATDVVQDEWFEGMAAAASLRTTSSSTTTLVASASTNGITVGFNSFTIAAGIAAASSSFVWQASR